MDAQASNFTIYQVVFVSRISCHFMFKQTLNTLELIYLLTNFKPESSIGVYPLNDF